MRVTNRMLHDTALRNLSLNLASLARSQEQVSSSKRLNRPSDSPADVRSAVTLRDGLAELDQYLRNADVADRTLSAADSALASSTEILQRARELAIQGASDSVSPADRQTIAIEVGQLLESLAERSAAQSAGTYLFSGFRTDTPPFATPTGPYQGDGGAILTRVGPGERLRVNVTADTAFAPGLAAIEALRAELAAGSRVSAATVTALDGGLEAVVFSRSQLGATQNRLQDVQAFLQDQVIAGRRLQTQLEDADLAVVITELTQREATYQAALQINARIVSRTLFDEL